MPYFHQHALPPNLLHLCQCRPSACCPTFSCSVSHSSVMEHANERWTQRMNQCCSWFIIWWLLCSSASIFLASLPPRSMVRYCIDSCGNDVSTVMEFSRSHSQSPDASCQQMVKACGMHNIIIGCRILHRHGRWPIVAANPLKWSEKSLPSHWPDKFAKAWWLSCTIVFVEVEDCRVQWCFRWLLLCGIQVLSSISWAN